MDSPPVIESPAYAEEAGGVVEVVAERPAASASEVVLDRAAVESRPGRSTDELMRAMPGLHESAHGGHGKAYQYFLRGFDAVHGADLAVDVEGVPANELSNVHAHGYLDLHFVPRHLVRGVQLAPGAWDAAAGDFATAGAASFTLGLEHEGGEAEIGVGTDNSLQATVAWRPRDSAPGSFVLADVDLGEGIGASRAWRQLRAAAGVEGALGATTGRGWVLAYDGVFASPGVLREDDLQSGDVSFYDAYPGSGGGRSTRVLAGGSLVGGDGQSAWKVTGWAGWRDFEVRQNFTGWYRDEAYGDGTRQAHTATTAGSRFEASMLPADWLTVRAGASLRVDALAQAEQGVTMEGVPWGDEATLRAVQSEAGVWVSAPMAPTRWLHLEPGLRGELFLLQPEGVPASWAPVFAPKLRVRLFEEEPVTGFASLGRGYRSPDVRGVGEGGVAPVSLADSAEVGVLANPAPWLALRAVGFGTYVSDEIVFDHAAARYLASGRTRRLGVDGGLSLRPVPGLRVDTNVTYADGVYVATGEPIPYAPRLLVVGGVYTEALPLAGGKLTAGARAWGLGPRPLPGGFVSTAAAVVDLTATYEISPWSLSLDVDNVLGTEWRDGEFLFASRWDLAAPRSELPVRHITAGTPRAVRLGVGRSF